MGKEAHLNVNIAQLTRELDTLGGFSSTPAPGVTRVLWTEEDLRARAYLKTLIEGAGLTWREDGLGNLFARWEGTVPELAPVATGSHADAIPHSGQYDGTVGVLGGLEAMRTLRREGFSPTRPIELLLFTAEEPTRFGLGCLGSRALSGALGVDELRALKDAGGVGLEDARRAAGYSAPLEGVRLEPGHYAAFVELHIEQGPELERAGVPVGLVGAIAAPASLFLHLEGEGGHAGARLMAGRRDALLSAAEVILAVERETLAARSPDAVGTVGLLKVHPGAINSIPARVTLGADLRDVDGARRDATVARVRAAARAVAARRGVSLREELLNADPPALCDPAILEVLRNAAREEGASTLDLPSRAYHDALFMARLCPVAMLFIPCRDGVSHRPDEFAAPGDIAVGVAVLARALAALAG